MKSLFFCVIILCFAVIETKIGVLFLQILWKN